MDCKRCQQKLQGGTIVELVLHQKQQLNLIMTFELRQAIELLQYSTYELYEYIKEQELENPLVELEEKDENWSGKSKSISSEPLIDFVRSNDSGMRINLFEQAKLLFKDVQDQQLLGYIIHNLDDNGYLSIGYEDYSENEIDRGIELLQQIGPIGIGARNLKECLLLQISHKYPDEKLAECLIHNHLELLANRRWDDIAAHLNISLAKVKDLYDLIQTLNPKPCSHLADFTVEYLNPDIIVETKETGISFYLNDNYLPTIHLNKDYSSLHNAKDDTSKYIADQYSRYQWLLNSIEQRRQTIIKIVKVIINKQESFFKEGFISLKPLTLKDVAEEIGMHESTVSRATTNKVIQTPKGTFDLRMFFTSKLETVDGDSISQTKVKALLETFIANENKLKPFSDQKIADYFNSEKGITISRRTISKYREELKIPSSSRRKEIRW
jgi:RNA polymerase sigma-54 factor